jgi:dephospho-CoA kinase
MVIGVTGSIGTGKTTVAKMFEKWGAYVIYADKIVHHILDKPTRVRLSAFVFDNKEALQKLCEAIHPIVKKEIFSKIRGNTAKKTVVIDAPLLIESGLDRKCDYVVAVKASQQMQVERAQRNLHLSRHQILKRIRMQMPLKKKTALADFVIDNNGDLKDTEKQAKRIWEGLRWRKRWKR